MRIMINHSLVLILLILSALIDRTTFLPLRGENEGNFENLRFAGDGTGTCISRTKVYTGISRFMSIFIHFNAGRFFVC